MQTELLDKPTESLILYDVTDDAIANLAERYLPVRVKDANDNAGFAIARAARIEVKALRCAVEKRRTELKADSLAFGRRVDSEAKRITALLAPIEQHLLAQEEIVLAEQKRIAEEAEHQREELLNSRLKRLLAVGVFADRVAVQVMSPESFETFYGTHAEIFDAKVKAEAERQAAEKRAKDEAAAKAKAEAEQLATERAELAKQRELQNEIQRKIDAERAELEREKNARLQAAEAARLKTEQEDRQRQLAEHEAQQEAERLARIEALKPDADRLLSVAVELFDFVVPAVSERARTARQEVVEILAKASREVRAIVARIGSTRSRPIGCENSFPLRP